MNIVPYNIYKYYLSKTTFYPSTDDTGFAPTQAGASRDCPCEHGCAHGKVTSEGDKKGLWSGDPAWQRSPELGGLGRRHACPLLSGSPFARQEEGTGIPAHVRLVHRRKHALLIPAGSVLTARHTPSPNPQGSLLHKYWQHAHLQEGKTRHRER